MKNFFSKLLVNLRKIYTGQNLRWHALAIVLTFFIVTTGLDWSYYILTRPLNFAWFWLPAGILGFILPVIVPSLFYIVGRYRGNLRMINKGLAVGQAVILAWFVSCVYKVFTGRVPPDLYNSMIDVSHGFRYGFWRGGVFWGWPSSHTTIAFAMAASLFVLYPKNSKVKFFAVLYAIYISFGASVGFHWFSEAVAGVIFGSLIGAIVGRSFLTK